MPVLQTYLPTISTATPALEARPPTAEPTNMFPERFRSIRRRSCCIRRHERPAPPSPPFQAQGQWRRLAYRAHLRDIARLGGWVDDGDVDRIRKAAFDVDLPCGHHAKEPEELRET